MLTRGDKGQAVTELQEQLVALGYPLPRWGADGSLGNETLGAVTRFLADHGDGYIDADPETVSDEELALIQKVSAATAWPIPVPGKLFYDLRRESDSRNIHGRRRWAQITGITMHQCGVDLGAEKPGRWDTLSAHVGASCEGNVFWVHELEHLVWHGNELNGSTVGLECEGLYPGVAGQPGQVVTPELVKAAQEAIRWICGVVQIHGGQVTHLYAHRQTAGSRRADPGEELWKLVALPVMAELGLSDGGPKFRIDNGRVIPEAWNPAYLGNAY